MVSAGAAELRRRAIDVLRANDAGRWTKPSPTQYPHQWNWDSAFISVGLATFDWDRAVVEVESMLDARWREGMLPHVRYDARHLADYFPGPDWWPGAQDHVARPGILTSGISNPPLLATAALRVGLRQPDLRRRHAFWRRTLPGLGDALRWFAERRRLPGSPLLVMVHPWESGWDNSPRWDRLAAAGLKPSRPYRRLDTRAVAASQRPGDKDYDAYLALAEILDGADYDVGAYSAASPFAVNDVFLDAAWYRGAKDLALVAGALGVRPPLGESELLEFAAAFEASHWNPAAGTYLDRDLKAGDAIAVETPAGLAALISGLAPPARAARMWRAYRRRCGTAVPVPTVPPGALDYQAGRYWRGPVWVNVNWLVALGLETSGQAGEAERLRLETAALVGRSGFHEYFDAETGAGLGSDGFSWTAALVLDLLAQ